MLAHSYWGEGQGASGLLGEKQRLRQLRPLKKVKVKLLLRQDLRSWASPVLRWSKGKDDLPVL